MNTPQPCTNYIVVWLCLSIGLSLSSWWLSRQQATTNNEQQWWWEQSDNGPDVPQVHTSTDNSWTHPSPLKSDTAMSYPKPSPNWLPVRICWRPTRRYGASIWRNMSTWPKYLDLGAPPMYHFSPEMLAIFTDIPTSVHHAIVNSMHN